MSAEEVSEEEKTRRAWQAMADAGQLADITDEIRVLMDADAPFHQMSKADLLAVVNQAQRTAEEQGFNLDDPEVRAAVVSLWVHGFVTGERYRQGQS